LGVQGRDRPRGGEGEEQGKVMPSSDSGSQSSREPESCVIVGSGTTMAACGVSSRMKKEIIEDKADDDVCQHRRLGD